MQFLPALTALHLDCAPNGTLSRAQSCSVTTFAGNEIGPTGIAVLAPCLSHLISLQILALGGELSFGGHAAHTTEPTDGSIQSNFVVFLTGTRSQPFGERWRRGVTCRRCAVDAAAKAVPPRCARLHVHALAHCVYIRIVALGYVKPLPFLLSYHPPNSQFGRE